MIFVTLEGIDNCGKTTLSKKLCKELSSQGKKVHCTRELITTDVGDIVLDSFRKGIKLSPQLKALYFAADRQIRYEEIIKQDYDVVIWDRYVYSSLVYREMESCNVAWVDEINKIFKVPELNIYMDVSLKTAMSRARENKRILPYTKKELGLCRGIYLRYVKENRLLQYQGYEWLLNEINKQIGRVNERD